MGDEDHLMYETGAYPTRLNSVKAKPILFPRVMCQKCNNHRSAPFDKAYDVFMDYIWDQPEYFRDKNWFDWSDIFNNPAEVGNLCRYYINNIGCRIAETGFAVPRELVQFLDGYLHMPHATTVLYKDYSTYNKDYSTYNPFSRVGLNGHCPVANRMYNPEKPTDGPLEAFCAEVQDGPIGVLYWWDAVSEYGVNFCSQRVIPLRWRKDLPYRELHEHECKRAEIMETGADRILARDDEG